MLALLLAFAVAAPSADGTPVHCGSCVERNAAQAPFRLFGDSRSVGTARHAYEAGRRGLDARLRDEASAAAGAP